MSDGPRLVAVLGYSRRRSRSLHAVCAARLERAEAEARPDDLVLLSGWARSRERRAEAELMASAWRGRAAELLVDGGARSTYGNAVAAARTARRRGVSEVVVVTSGWHGRRAVRLVRAALRHTDVRVRLATTDERGALRARAREVACWSLVPVLAALAARSR